MAITDPAADLPPRMERCAKVQIGTSTDAELARLQLDIPTYVKLLLSCDPNVLYDHQRRGLAAGDLGSETNRCILKASRGLATGRPRSSAASASRWS